MATTSSTIRIVIDGVTDGLRGAAGDAIGSLLGLRAETEKADKSLLKVAGTVGKVGVGLAGVGSAIPALVGVATSAVTLGGALLLLPGAALAGGAAMATLKLATTGFGDAIAETDPKKFAEATASMAPAMRDAALATQQLVQGPLADLRRSVQGAFFTGFTADVQQLAGTYLPLLNTQLTGIATSYAAMREDATDALIAPGAVEDVNQVLGDTNTILRDAQPALANVLTGILAIGSEGTAEFDGLGQSITDATEKFRIWAQSGAESGRFTELIREGREEFRLWGVAAGAVGGVVQTIFTGLTGDQENFVVGLARSTVALDLFLQSAEGQDALRALGELLSTVSTVVRGVFLEALTSIAPVIQGVSPAVAEFAEIIGGVLVGAIEIVGPPLAAFGGFLSDNAGLVSFLTPLIIGLVIAFQGLSILGSLVLPLAALVLALNAVGLATGRLTLALRLLSLATGPIGIALAAGGIALGIFAAANAGADEAVAAHKAQVEGIIGTLDTYTGRVTDATRAQVASELAAKTLADGTTTLNSAVADAGISWQDYVDAASGGEAAITKVNGALLTSATAFIENEANLGRWGKTLADAQVPTETLALAVIGNEEAVTSLTEQYGISEGVVDALVGALRNQIGTLDEVGQTLGSYTAALKDAQTQADLTKASIQEFSTVLGGIEPGLAGLANGAAPLNALVVEFGNLSASAREAAQSAGESAVQFGGVEAGAIRAGQSMATARQSFIDAATGAGVTAERAAQLADQLGLIPAVAETDFRTNATEVGTQLLGLQAQFAAIPGSKVVTVNALTQEAIDQLETLGFTVRELPNGQFEVIAETDGAKTSLDALMADAAARRGFITFDANTDPAITGITGAVTFGNGQVGTMTLNANADPATGEINGTVALGDGSIATMTLDANPDPATGKITATVRFADGSTGTVVVNANDTAARAAIDRLKEPTSSIHTIRINQIANRSYGSPGFSGGGIVGAAGGMIVPGYGPGRDTFGPVWLSPGEAVLVPELVRRIGAGNILRENYRMSGGRPATMIGPGLGGMGMAGGGLAANSGEGLLARAGTADLGSVIERALATAPSREIVVNVLLDGEPIRSGIRTAVEEQDRETVRRARVGGGVSY